MSDPTKFIPGYSYSGWQASYPIRPLPAQQVDNDFANASRAINQTIDALKDIRRSDGKLKNGIVTPDALSPVFSLGFTFRGAWVEGESYIAGDGVVYDNVFYAAAVSHTSTMANAPGAGSTWTVLFSLSDILVAGALSMPSAKFSGNGVDRLFELDFMPLSGENLLVVVGGVIQEVSEYSVSGTTLEFFTAPPAVPIDVRGFATTASMVVPQDGSVTEEKLDPGLSATLFGAMQPAQYDPTGVGGDAFDLSKMHGQLPAPQLLGLQKSKDTPYNKARAKNNAGLSGTFGVKLKPPAFSNVRGQQGITWVEPKPMFYSTWTRSNGDGSERVNLVRHDGAGNVIDYGTTVGPGTGFTSICFDHGQDLDWFLDIQDNLFFVTDGGGALGATSRGASVFEFQQAGSIGPDADGWDIIVSAGQSNMAGVSTGTVPNVVLDVSDADIYEIRDGAIVPTVATIPLGHPTSNLNGYGPGPELEFAKVYKKKKLRSRRKILILPVAVSSTAITAGGPWAVGGTHYLNMLAKIALAMALPGSNRVVALLWSQGETDANRTQVGGTSATTQEYRDAFHPVIDGFRACTPSAAYAPIVIMGMEPAWVAAQAYRQPVQTALQTVPTFKKWTAYSEPPSGMAVALGDIHFSAAGNRLRGRNAFLAWSAAVDNTFGVAGTPVVLKDFILQPATVTSGTVSLSTDKKHLVKTGGPLADGKKNIRIFELDVLMAGPSGDRQSDCWWEMEQPDMGGLPGQGLYMHDGRLYMLNGTQALTAQTRVTVIDIASKTVIDTMYVDTGLDLARLQNNGAGAKNEPEGCFVVRPQAGGPLQFWMGVGQDNADGSGISTFAFPLFKGDFGAVTADGKNSPLDIAVNFAGKHKAAHSRDERFTFSSYRSSLEGTPDIRDYLSFDDASDTVVSVYVQEADGLTFHSTEIIDRVTGKKTFPGGAENAGIEGEWTPIITFGGAAVGMAPAAQPKGRWTKVGKRVNAECRITLTAKGTSTGIVEISGLPFPSKNSSNSRGHVSSSLYNNFAAAVASMPFGLVGSNGTKADLRTGAAGGNLQLTNAHFTDTSDIFLEFTYEAAS